MSESGSNSPVTWSDRAEGGEESHKEVVLEAEPAPCLVGQAPAPEGAHHVEGSRGGHTHPQKARPSTAVSPSRMRGRPERRGGAVGREQGGEEKQGIEIQEQLDGIAQLVGPLLLRLGNRSRKSSRNEPCETRRSQTVLEVGVSWASSVLSAQSWCLS